MIFRGYSRKYGANNKSYMYEDVTIDGIEMKKFDGTKSATKRLNRDTLFQITDDLKKMH